MYGKEKMGPRGAKGSGYYEVSMCWGAKGSGYYEVSMCFGCIAGK